MLRVLEYYFDDDANLALRLALIRRGSGHHGLAHDLLALAELYEDKDTLASIRSDAKHYARTMSPRHASPR